MHVYIITIIFAHLAVCYVCINPDHASDDDWEPFGSKIKSSHQHDAIAASAASGFLLSGAADKYLNLSNSVDAKIDEILDRDGPDMRPSRDYRDYKDIDIEVALRSWTLLRRHAFRVLSNQLDTIRPVVVELLDSSQVSNECKQAALGVFQSAKNLDSWAVKLLNSWPTFPPTEVFEGTYTSLGSYSTCINLPYNPYIDHTHYCTLTFRPILPSRPDYELVIRKEPDRLLKMFRPNRTNRTFDRDAFEDLLEHSQYHHYVYYKLGTCWPIGCSPNDVRLVARLIGRRNILMHGPVKCYSKNVHDYKLKTKVESSEIDSALQNRSMAKEDSLVISTWDLNKGSIFIWKPHTTNAQIVALLVITTTSAFIIIMTIVDLITVRLPRLMRTIKSNVGAAGGNSEYLPGRKETYSGSRQGAQNASVDVESHQLNGDEIVGCSSLYLNDLTSTPIDLNGVRSKHQKVTQVTTSKLRSEGLVSDFSIVTNTMQFFRISQGQLKSDILCLNGIRCITMFWIIMTHTMMYNDWSAFARTREIEKSLKSLVTQPLFNGSYLVDSFFFMSGLLSSFTAFKHCQGIASKFKSFAFILGRWLRLTPQIFLVSMIYIVWPLTFSGPHWFPLVGEYSENCQENWWINVLHLQSFYKKEKMCNFVTWWISIDFFYHFLAVLMIWIFVYANHKLGFASTAMLVGGHVAWQATRHYSYGLPPNIFATIPQTGAMWTRMTLDFFWTPHAHAVPFFFGFYVGYIMSMKRKSIMSLLNRRVALIGWTISTLVFVGQSYSTFWWVTGEAGYDRLGSTIFHVTCPILWAACLSWTVLACHHGYGGFVNSLLSARVFVVLGKASYMVYLSHFLILFLFYGTQNLLLEPSQLVMLYVILGNTLLSTLLGIFLCVVYEIPWLKVHRRLMKYV